MVGVLRCPICSEGLAVGKALTCGSGHSFDVARQGYANLLTGNGRVGTADTAAMVAARAEFLGAGHYQPIASRLSEIAAEIAEVAGPGCVVDAGAGTGYYLARVLDGLPGRAGVAMDLSKYALRRAARAHRAIGAVVSDVWRPMPLRDGVAAVVLNVFAPRNGAEFRRILHPGGSLIVVTPTAGHLAEIVENLGLLAVDPRKEQRTAETLGEFNASAASEELTFTMRLTRAELTALVGMGPNAWHTDAASLTKRIGGLEEPVRVTGAVRLTAFRGS